MQSKPSLFAKLSKHTSDATGSPIAFALAVVIVIVWGVTGPVFGFSDTWQLIINTGTTIATFLMVFLMQNTQNRDTRALQVKLDELIRALEGADNQLLNLENIEPADLEKLQLRYEKLAEKSRALGGDKSTPDID